MVRAVMRRLVLSWALRAGACAPALRAQSPRRTTRNARSSKARHSTGVEHVDVHDLKKSISTQASEVQKPHPRAVSACSAIRRRSRTSTTSTRTSCARDICASASTTGSAAIARPRSTPPSRRTGRQQGHGRRSRSPRARRRSSATLAIVYDSTLISDKARNRLTLLHAERSARPRSGSTRCACCFRTSSGTRATATPSSTRASSVNDGRAARRRHAHAHAEPAHDGRPHHDHRQPEGRRQRRFATRSRSRPAISTGSPTCSRASAISTSRTCSGSRRSTCRRSATA